MLNSNHSTRNPKLRAWTVLDRHWLSRRGVLPGLARTFISRSGPLWLFCFQRFMSVANKLCGIWVKGLHQVRPACQCGFRVWEYFGDFTTLGFTGFAFGRCITTERASGLRDCSKLWAGGLAACGIRLELLLWPSEGKTFCA